MNYMTVCLKAAFTKAGRGQFLESLYRVHIADNEWIANIMDKPREERNGQTLRQIAQGSFLGLISGVATWYRDNYSYLEETKRFRIRKLRL